jgi:serine/threonine protein kinase
MATIPLTRSLVGERVGSYVVERELGGGGMGAVFVARHAVLGQKTAVIKVLHAELAMRRDLVARFEGEARAATAIAHPSIVHVEDFGTLSTGEPYIVMEHLAGGDLAQYVAEHAPIALEEVLAIMLQVCPGLDAAHDRGIIHRDLKPANIFRLPDGRVKILDFGIAKLADDLATPFPDVGERRGRHAGVHVAGAVPEHGERRPPLGRLRARRHPLRPHHRAAALELGDPGRPRPSDRPRAAAASARAAPGASADLE